MTAYGGCGRAIEDTGYMPAELMTAQAPVMPTKTAIATWTMLPWKEEMSREELLAVRIRQVEGRPADIAEAIRRQQDSSVVVYSAHYVKTVK